MSPETWINPLHSSGQPALQFYFPETILNQPKCQSTVTTKQYHCSTTLDHCASDQWMKSACPTGNPTNPRLSDTVFVELWSTSLNCHLILGVWMVPHKIMTFLILEWYLLSLKISHISVMSWILRCKRSVSVSLHITYCIICHPSWFRCKVTERGTFLSQNDFTEAVKLNGNSLVRFFHSSLK